VKPQHTQPKGGWATTAEDLTGYHSSPLQIGKRDYNLQELPVEDWKNVAWLHVVSNSVETFRW